MPPFLGGSSSTSSSFTGTTAPTSQSTHSMNTQQTFLSTTTNTSGGSGPMHPNLALELSSGGMEFEERPKKDKTLGDFLKMMDESAPIIPDAVTDYYLSLSGLSTTDVRLKRLLALATQKFISEVAADAFQYSKIRQGGAGGGGGGIVGGGGGGGGGNQAIGLPGPAVVIPGEKKGGKNVLMMEDLGCAVAEYGVDVRRGEFHR